MIRQTPKTDWFKQQPGDSLTFQAKNARTVKIAKNENIYTCGDKSENVYLIESGQIKLLMLSPAGKECLLAIYFAGDIFGEQCLSHSGERRETATAMKETVLRKIPSSRFFLHLRNDSLVEGLVRHLVLRIADQQDVINNLVTVDSERRLGKTLLRLAGKCGTSYKITHEELSEMIGTTRPRVSKFMRRFRELGLIEMSTDHFIIVKEKHLTEYLNQWESHSRNNICNIV